MEKKKKSRKCISLEMKIEILDRLSNGERPSVIGRFFNLGESTIRGIRNNETAIRKSAHIGTNVNSKVSSYSRNVLLEKMERAVLIWVEELTQKRVPLNGCLIQQKALAFYEKMRELDLSTSCQIDKSFSASKGWLTRFLKRNSLKMSDEVASAKKVIDFQEKLAKMIKDGEYLPDQVFNADETDLYWKQMPGPTNITEYEKKARGFKAGKDRITVLLCSNASGDRMLTPLVVNRFQRPRALKHKNLQKLPVHWMANSKAWVTAAIFQEWFYNCFVPEIENYMKEKALDFKALLILDNAPGHMHFEHPNVKIIFFPPNITSVIQPLDQDVIATFKKYYIKFTLEFIIDKIESKTLTSIDAWKQFSILDCINHIALSVTHIKPSTLNACWEMAWPECVHHSEPIQTSQLSDEIITLAQNIGGEGFDTFNEDDIKELLIDEPLNDDDIIAISLERMENSILDTFTENDIKQVLINEPLNEDDTRIIEVSPEHLENSISDTFNEIDIKEELIDELLNDNYIRAISLEHIENDNPEVKTKYLSEKNIAEGLRLSDKLENHFLTYDTNGERASKFQKELQKCVMGYRALYEELRNELFQTKITDYFEPKRRKMKL